EWNYERPVHAVSLDAFKISTTEITQEQFKAVMGFNPSLFSGSPNLPVERVTWINAATFCNKLSLMTSLDTCYNLNTLECDFARSGYRLPTEAEWEYACRAGTASEYYIGSDTVSMKTMAWCLSNSESTTHPVGMKEPNAWGLYDMHGNVFEWCADYYAIYHCSSEDNPQGPAAGRYRTIRGGSWFSGPDSCRSAFRMSTYPFKGFSNVGFRVVHR
ncbi:MAG: formylglycine-generating enzyme family protein, partial [Candidatus Glassbacteria bacterium]|nr:formylglycine-generating enzyme family protein [Candidatus Glassbacteria bacterium]